MAPMNSRRPSKKRNALLIFEFLTKAAASNVIAGNAAAAEKVLSLIKEAFASGTELHRELRLARSLHMTRVSSPAVAAHILTEARAASKSLDGLKLDTEKTKLIASIARDVDPTGALYEEQLPQYRMLSTIGTLLSDWRVGSHDLQRIASYEDQLMEHLMARVEDPPASLDPADNMSPGERRALIAIMSRKVEEKWGKALSKEQRSLLREYVVVKDPKTLLEKLRSIRDEAIRCLDECRSDSKGTDAAYFVERLEESKQTIANRSLECVDDESVGQALLHLKLIAETKEADDV